MASWFIHQVNELRLNVTPGSSLVVVVLLWMKGNKAELQCLSASFSLNPRMWRFCTSSVQDPNPSICHIVHSTAFPSSDEILIKHLLSWYKSQIFWLLLACVLCLNIKSSWSWTRFHLCFPQRWKWHFNNSTGVFQKTFVAVVNPQTSDFNWEYFLQKWKLCVAL